MWNISAILEILDCIAPLTAIIFLIVGRKNFSKELTAILIFCCIQFVSNMTALIVEKHSIASAWLFYQWGSTACFLLLVYLFTRILIHIHTIVIRILLLTCTLISVWLFNKEQSASPFINMAIAFESLVIMGLSSYYFYLNLIKKSDGLKIPDTTIFWCIAGIFIYYTGMFILFISSNYLLHIDETATNVLQQFRNTLLFICCSYICYGVTRKSYQPIFQ